MRHRFALAAVVVLAGCGGGGTSVPPPVVQYQLAPSITPPLTAPVPVGGSVTIVLREQRCRYTARPNGPPIGAGDCDPWYAPTSLNASTEPKANTQKPCPLTIQQTAAGTLVVTRTGPGDPVTQIGNTSGGCDLDIRDPQTGALAFLIV